MNRDRGMRKGGRKRGRKKERKRKREEGKERRLWLACSPTVWLSKSAPPATSLVCVCVCLCVCVTQIMSEALRPHEL